MIMLQVCQSCKNVHYPERDICSVCLSQDLMWEEISGDGTLISSTKLHISAKKQWQDKLPVLLGLVKLNMGPKILTFLEINTLIGSNVTLTQDGETFTARNRGKNE